MNPQANTGKQIQMRIRPHAADYTGSVHCPICTHTVRATVEAHGRTVRVKPGQKCPRCQSTLDAGYVLRFDRAA